MSLKRTALLLAVLLVPGLAAAQSIGTPDASSYGQPTIGGQQQQARRTPSETAILGGLMIRNFTWPEQEGIEVLWIEEEAATTAFVASIEGNFWYFELGRGTTTYTNDVFGSGDRSYTMLGLGMKAGYTPFVKDARSGFEVGMIWSTFTDRLWWNAEDEDVILSMSLGLPTLRMKYGAFVADARIGEIGWDFQAIGDESRMSFAFIPTVMLRAGARF